MNTLVRSLAVAALSFGLLTACSGKSGGSASTADGDMDLGDPKAPVTLVEYASATCVHCARFDKTVFPSLKARYIDTGKVHYVFREFLTAPEQVAAASFVLARCAGKDKYFQVVEAVFRAQDEMFSTGDTRGPLVRIARSMGMTDEKFQACTSDTAALDALNKRVQHAIDVDKISGTPTFIVNGKTIASGETTLETLAKAIDEAAAAAKK